MSTTHHQLSSRMMADPSPRDNARTFLAYDPAAYGASTARRTQRSATDGRINTLGMEAQSNAPTATASVSTPPPRSSTPARTGSTSYFDTYQPYKLNPALTPSLRSSKSKPDLSSTARKSRQRENDQPSSASSRSAVARPRKTDDPETIRSAKVEAPLVLDKGRSSVAGPPPQPQPQILSRSKLDAQALAQAGLDQDGSSADRAASVDSWRKLAAAAAQRSPGGYASSGVVASVTRRKSRNDLHAMAAEGSNNTVADTTLPDAETTKSPTISSPAIWRQRAHALHHSASSSRDTTLSKTANQHAACSHRTARPEATRSDAVTSTIKQTNASDATASTIIVKRSNGSEATTSTLKPPIRLGKSPSATTTPEHSLLPSTIPGLAASREALQSHVSQDIPSIDEIIRRGSSATFASRSVDERPKPPRSASTSPPPEEVPATFAASPVGMGRRTGAHPKVVQQPVKSIDEIIREHSPQPQLKSPASPTRTADNAHRLGASSLFAPSANPMDRRVSSNPGSWGAARHIDQGQSESEDSDNSIDSVTREVRRTLRLNDRRRKSPEQMRVDLPTPFTADTGKRPKKPRKLHHATSFPSKARLESAVDSAAPPLPSIVRSTTTGRANTPGVQWPTDGRPSSRNGPGLPDHLRLRTGSLSSANSVPISLSKAKPSEESGPAAFVRSHKLTKLLSLDMADGRRLNVSLADVGAPHGHPVFVYLGLGAVRYLTGLYDELASLFSLRLICVDRWGLGKTDDVSSEKRGVLQWSSVIARVADALSISQFSILAHSAGAPYAMATALLHGNRVRGPIHLLAPWVSVELESGYKWLRYVPEQVIRTAQAAEWRLAGWRLGKGVETSGDAGMLESTTITEPRDSTSATSDRKGPRGGEMTTPVLDSEARINSTTMRVALPSPVTGLTSPTPSAMSQSLRTPSRNKTSFLGAFFSGGSSKAAAATATTLTDDGSHSQPDLSPLTGSDSWTGGALTPSMRTDEDTWVASRELTTPESVHLDSRWPSSREGTSSKSGSLLSAEPKRPDAEGDAEFLTDAEPSLNMQALEWPYETAQRSRRSESGSVRARGRFSSTFGSQSVKDEGEREGGGDSTTSSRAAIAPPMSRSTSTTVSGPEQPALDLATTLLRASHAESQRGSTNDLLTILGGRGSRPWGFSYTDVSHATKVWHGDRDERIGVGGALWMEREMRECELKIVKGANHSLMTNTAVVIEALESISTAWQ